MGDMAGTNAVETQGLRKVYGEQTAVADLTLTVPRGEVFGFLGPNGAGKTTAVKMLLGLVAPTAGEAFVLDLPVGDPKGRARAGFLPEHFRFHDWLRATEFLKLHADLYGVPFDVSRQRIPELLELVDMLQRIGLAQTLLNDPELVFLDEPTSGLDPMGRRLVRDIIHTLRERRTTVFLNSHLLSEVEITCDRVAFIRRGELVRISALEDLVNGELVVRLRVGPQRPRIPPDVLVGLAAWGDNVRAEGDRITLTAHGEADLPEIARYLIGRGFDLYELSPQRVSLEELFVEIVGGETG